MSQFYTTFFIDFENELTSLKESCNNIIHLAKRIIYFVEAKLENLNDWLPPLPRESLRVVLQFKILKNTNIV